VLSGVVHLNVISCKFLAKRVVSPVGFKGTKAVVMATEAEEIALGPRELIAFTFNRYSNPGSNCIAL
jgi:hypothetical protein